MTEFIRNIPSLWTEFSSLLNDCMEECQIKYKFSPNLRLCTFVDEILGDVFKSFLEICSHTSRRLIGQLNRILEHWYWEIGSGRGSQKEPEILMGLIFFLRELED